MGIRILEGDFDEAQSGAVMVANGQAFGPVFDDREQVERFLKLCPEPRSLPDGMLPKYFIKFLQTELQETLCPTTYEVEEV